ncbi:MAG: CD225/dispanin family protein [Victivallaceae bacterium]|nr:CD225/dispanin family protein [Victivallaceae bacterium]
MSLAIVLTVLCWVPCVVALCHAVRAAELWDAGQRDVARRMAEKSRKWSIATMIVMALLCSL